MYNEIIEAAKTSNAAVQYHFIQNVCPELKMKALAMVRPRSPWSITEPEFNYFRRIIAKHQLKRGFEMATGFGISSLGIGLGMKETGGKLVTMDAYVEETLDTSDYKNIKKNTFADSNGFKSVNFLIDHFGVREHVVPTVGWSPDDNTKFINEHFGDQKLDFAFIDGGHWDEAVIRDLTPLIGRMSDNYLVLLHDSHSMTEVSYRFIRENFGQECRLVPELKIPHGWNTTSFGPLA